MAFREERTEHAGAKNGGGFWGPRAQAKAESKKRRRVASKLVIREQKET